MFGKNIFNFFIFRAYLIFMLRGAVFFKGFLGKWMKLENARFTSALDKTDLIKSPTCMKMVGFTL